MRPREVVLLIFIIGLGVLLTQTYRGNINWEWDWDNWDGPFFTASHEAAAQESRTFEAPLPGELAVVNTHGEVRVEPSADGRITVTLEKKAWRRTDEEAREAVESLHLTVDQGASRLALSTNAEDLPRKRFRTVFRITAPEGLAVDIQNSYGPVKTVRTGRTTVVNSHGPVTAEDVRGAYTGRTTYEDISVSDVAAECRVEARHGAVTVLRVKGPAVLSDTYGDLRVEDAAGDVTVTCAHTDVIGRRLAGTVKVETTYRDISLVEVGPATVVGHHSAVEVLDARGPVDITDSYGRVVLQRIRGSLKVGGRSLEISGRTITGPEISVSTSYQSIDLADFAGRTDITASHSNIVLAPASLEAGLRVKNDYGEVRFTWPDALRNPLEARTRYGKVRWNLPQAPDVSESDGESFVRAFGNETGRPPVSLSTSYADIIIGPASAQNK
jgi:hypothetical protein